MRIAFLDRDIPRPGVRPKGTERAVLPPKRIAGRRTRPQEIEDVLQALPDRKDLQELYDRHVPLDQIVRLLGHQVDRGCIDQLLACEDPHWEIRRILGSV